MFVHDRDYDEDGVFDERDPGSFRTVNVSISDNQYWNYQGGGMNPDISASGRYITFNSYHRGPVFVHDRDYDNDGILDEREPGAFRTIPVSKSGTGRIANGHGQVISGDGRFVAFVSRESYLTDGLDENDTWDVFVHDRDNDEDGIYDEPEPGAITTSLVSMTRDGSFSDVGGSTPAMSDDGRYIAFESANQIVVHDRTTQTSVLVSRQTHTYYPANGVSTAPVITADGRFIAFTSNASDIGDAPETEDWKVFLHDRDSAGDEVFDEVNDTRTVCVSDGRPIRLNPQVLAVATLAVGFTNVTGELIVRGPDQQPDFADVGVSSVVHIPEDDAYFQVELRVSNQGPARADGLRLDIKMRRGGDSVSLMNSSPCFVSVNGADLECQLRYPLSRGTYHDLTLVFSPPWVPRFDRLQKKEVSFLATVSSDQHYSRDCFQRNNERTVTIEIARCNPNPQGDTSCFVCDVGPRNGQRTPESVSPEIDFWTLWALRDRIMNTTGEGRRYVELYYSLSPEVISLVTANPRLRDEALETLRVWQPSLKELVEGRGDTVYVTHQKVQAVRDFLNNLSAAGSPELQQIIADELALHPLDSFVGKTLDDARGAAVGYSVRFPLVAKP